MLVCMLFIIVSPVRTIAFGSNYFFFRLRPKIIDYFINNASLNPSSFRLETESKPLKTIGNFKKGISE